MKNAEEMFKELGWVKYINKEDGMFTYTDEEDTYCLVDFYLDTKDYCCFDNSDEIIEQKNKKVLKAIDKQLEELGWK